VREVPAAMTGDVSGRGDRFTRAFDLLLSMLGIVVLAPMFLAIAAAIRAETRGPVFFRQERAGRGGVPFRIWKFRSMVDRAEVGGPALTVAGDPRITRVGHVLRTTKLDELPQLFNVVAGDMSLVGPRPEHPRYVECYTPAQRRVLSVRPGLTSAASLAFHDESALLTDAEWERIYTGEILPKKLAIELDYLATRTLMGDLAVIARTTVLFFRLAQARRPI
jgi:lipopolysaccharide/colanic/teichoic acid biosynthesis glycosyltransferase